MRSPLAVRALRALLALALLLALVAAPAGAQDAPVRITAVGQIARVHTARAGVVVPERDVFLRGVDLELWRPLIRAHPSHRIGLGLRAHQSTRGGDDLTYADLSALYAWRRVAGELAYGRRTGYDPASGLAHGAQHDFARVGFRASAPVARSPLSLEMRVSRFIPLSGPDLAADALVGWDGETAMRWSFSRLPLDAIVGYRYERFRVYRTEQEVSALRLGLAWRSGGAK